MYIGQGWKGSVYKQLSAVLRYNSRRKISSIKQANACTQNHWRAWECLNCTRVIDNITERGRSKQTSSCTATKPLSKHSFFSNLSRNTSSFFLTVPLFGSPPLCDFSTVSAESGRYCLPFFSLSRSNSNQTLQRIVPLLPQLLFDSGSEGSAYIGPFFLAMGRLTRGVSAGLGFLTGTQRSADKAPSLV